MIRILHLISERFNFYKAWQLWIIAWPPNLVLIVTILSLYIYWSDISFHKHWFCIKSLWSWSSSALQSQASERNIAKKQEDTEKWEVSLYWSSWWLSPTWTEFTPDPWQERSVGEHGLIEWVMIETGLTTLQSVTQRLGCSHEMLVKPHLVSWTAQ